MIIFIEHAHSITAIKRDRINSKYISSFGSPHARSLEKDLGTESVLAGDPGSSEGRSGKKQPYTGV